MTTTLDTLARGCHDILAAGDTPAHREQLAALLRDALKDAAFVRSQFGPGAPERKIVYEDPDLKFCILAHEYHAAKHGGPHDHGPSWAIYGQAEGESEMSEFEVVAPATTDAPAKVRRTRTYTMQPGDVYVYNEGAVHAPSREGFNRLIRIEGVDLANVKRGTYEEAAG